MINDQGLIEVPVGKTFNDGDNSYRAIMPHCCAICAFFSIPFYARPCHYLACLRVERSDGMGVHFIKEGGDK